MQPILSQQQQRTLARILKRRQINSPLCCPLVWRCLFRIDHLGSNPSANGLVCQDSTYCCWKDASPFCRLVICSGTPQTQPAPLLGTRIRECDIVLPSSHWHGVISENNGNASECNHRYHPSPTGCLISASFTGSWISDTVSLIQIADPESPWHH